MKSSLSIEKQKNSLLGEEVKIKKGTVERLRSELENTKEQLEYMKEEKGKKNIVLCPGHILWRSKVVFKLSACMITGARAVWHKTVLCSDTVYSQVSKCHKCHKCHKCLNTSSRTCTREWALCANSGVTS